MIKNKDEPWLTPELKARIAEKNLALKKARRTNSVLDWFIANELKNAISTDVKEAHKTHVVDEVESNVEDPKKFWSAMKELIPGNKVKSKQINLKDENNQNIEPPEASDYINNFFAKIGPKLAENHNQEWSFDGTEVQDNMPDFKIFEEEVLKVVNDLNTNKSSAIDYVSTLVFKHAVLAMPRKFVKI